MTKVKITKEDIVGGIILGVSVLALIAIAIIGVQGFVSLLENMAIEYGIR